MHFDRCDYSSSRITPDAFASNDDSLVGSGQGTTLGIDKNHSSREGVDKFRSGNGVARVGIVTDFTSFGDTEPFRVVSRSIFHNEAFHFRNFVIPFPMHCEVRAFSYDNRLLADDENLLVIGWHRKSIDLAGLVVSEMVE
jgi:hypothetical protein